MLCIAQIPLGSSCRASRDERVWAVLFDKLDTAKMHGPDTSNVSSRVSNIVGLGLGLSLGLD